MPDFDLGVIGSGPGGYVAAIHAARLGARVAVIELKDSEWAGTCLNWGCIPTKALVQSAEMLHAVRRAEEFGVRVAEPEVDWPAMQARKDRVVSGLRQGVLQLLEANGVEMITGRGRLLGGTRLSADGRQLEARHVLLAPGSVVALPPLPGAELGLTSDTILALERVPESLVVIGGGVVGMEFAGIFSLLGTRVTVVEMLDQLLVLLDPEVARRFQQLMARRGVSPGSDDHGAEGHGPDRRGRAGVEPGSHRGRARARRSRASHASRSAGRGCSRRGWARCARSAAPAAALEDRPLLVDSEGFADVAAHQPEQDR